MHFEIQLTFWENHLKVLSAMRLILDLYINSDITLLKFNWLNIRLHDQSSDDNFQLKL